VLKSALIAATDRLMAAAPVPSRTGARRAPAFDAEDVLAKTRAAYAALASYADSGTVLDEAPGFTDRSTFRTLFIRDPRYLLVEYRAVASEYKNGYRWSSTTARCSGWRTAKCRPGTPSPSPPAPE
jgi:hypothetical protein